MTEHVILFAGPMGAGKTTAIASLSDIDVVRTEAANTDRESFDKETTTVALDYGEITVGDEEKVRLYGVPGQRRFDFMWRILAERAKGLVLLVNNDADDPAALVLEYLDEFHELHERGGVVVAVSRTDIAPEPGVEVIAEAVARARPGTVIPVFPVDPRDAGHMRMVLMSLIVNLETRAALAGVRP